MVDPSTPSDFSASTHVSCLACINAAWDAQAEGRRDHVPLCAETMYCVVVSAPVPAQRQPPRLLIHCPGVSQHHVMQSLRMLCTTSKHDADMDSCLQRRRLHGRCPPTGMQPACCKRISRQKLAGTRYELRSTQDICLSNATTMVRRLACLACRGGHCLGDASKQACGLPAADAALRQEPAGGEQGHAQVLGPGVWGDLPGRRIHLLHHRRR